jgi:choline dehydrogenase-like flavoprotein
MDKVDVVVIGSGAAGSVMAWRLACKGLSVVVLERGAHEDPTTFEHSELQMMPRLYKHGGLQTTADRNLVILQGRTVGGSTVINNAIWLRADLDRVLKDWAGAGAHVRRASIEAGYAALERVLNVGPIPQNVANEATSFFLDGGAKSGIHTELLNHNRKDCLGCGWCNYGCRFNRKTSMLVTLLPWAMSKGAVVRDQCENVRLVHEDGQVKSVEWQYRGQPQSLTANRYVVCGGAIGSSEILLSSSIDQNGTVGTKFHVLGGLTVTAALPVETDPFDGIGLTAMATQVKGHVVESFFSPPGAFAVSVPGWFEDHANLMSQYSRAGQAGTMIGTRPRGLITLDDDGKTKIDLAFTGDEVGALMAGVEDIAKIFFAAGATAVYPGTHEFIKLTPSGGFDAISGIRDPQDLLLGSAHPQGGNPMSEDPSVGVVGADFRVHGFDNLFVADASVFPTNIWANCQATVMAMSHYASEFVME